VGAAALTASAQLNGDGTGYVFNTTDASSNCNLNFAPGNQGVRVFGGNIDDGTTYLPAGGPFTLLTVADPGAWNVAPVWFDLPTVVGDGESAQCSNLKTEGGVDMSNNSSVTLTVSADGSGDFYFWIGTGGTWSVGSSTYDINDGSYGNIPCMHSFSGAGEETFSFDFNALDNTVWSAWSGKSSVEAIGFTSTAANVTFEIKQIKFGADADSDSNDGGDTGDNGGGDTGDESCTSINDAGKATWYVNLEDQSHNLYTGLVRCSFERSDIVGTNYGALDIGKLQEDNDAKYCGMCVEATGPAGTALVQIVDECPDCWDRDAGGNKLVGTNTKFGDIDLSPSAFNAVIGAESIGIGDFTWKETSCPFTTPIDVIVEGSNPFYAKVIISNHVNRIKNVEVQQEGQWSSMTRGNDNGWISTGIAINESSKTFRITDVYDQTVEVSGIDFSADPTNSKTAGTTNFPKCTITSTGELINALDYVTVFPNPANSMVTFDGISDVKNIQIMNINGQVVASNNFLNSISQASLDISGLPSGIYVAKMTGESTTGSVTFVKK
jgi:expansin (peptidoglycan-binding protein)